MEAEDLVVDESGEREVVKEVGEVLPDIGVAVLAEALVIEAVHLSNLARFVVAAENGDAGGVSDLECDEEGNGLDGVVSTVNIVAWWRLVGLNMAASSRRTHKEIVGIWVGTTNAEELHEIVKLAVDVAADGDRAFLVVIRGALDSGASQHTTG